MTEHPNEEGYCKYVLAELRLTRRRVGLLIEEIDTIGVALKGGVIGPDAAIAWLNEAKALEFLKPTEPAMEETK